MLPERKRQDWVGWGGAGQREKPDIKSPMGKESSGGLLWRQHRLYCLLPVLGCVEWGMGSQAGGSGTDRPRSRA